MGNNLPAYEVRCAQCDVSFPVGTKVCIHCGGRTGKSSQFVALESLLSESGLREDGESDPWSGGYADDDASGDVSAADSYSTAPAGPSVFGEPGVDDARRDGSIEIEEDLPSGAQGTILKLVRSMGGVIWIVLFIIFSLAQNCEN